MCVAHGDAVDGIAQQAPVGGLNCSTVVGMDPAGKVLLLETMGARAHDEDWARRHFKNRSSQPPEGLESPKDAAVAHLSTLIGDERLIVGWPLGFELASLGLGVSSILAVDLASDLDVRAFLQELVQNGVDVAKEVAHFILNNAALAIPIRMACALFPSMKVHLRHAAIPARDVLRDAYFIAAIWRLLGEKIVEERLSVGKWFPLWNAVYLGAGQRLEQISVERRGDPAALRVAMPETNLRGDECTLEAEATLGAFTSFLRYSTRFTATATHLNPAAPWQVELYASDLQHYDSAIDAHQQRIQAPRWKFDMRFQPATKTSKDLESHGVDWSPNEMCYSICVLECVLSRNPCDLFGYQPLFSIQMFPMANSRMMRLAVTQPPERRRREPAQQHSSHWRRLREERV